MHGRLHVKEREKGRSRDKKSFVILPTPMLIKYTNNKHCSSGSDAYFECGNQTVSVCITNNRTDRQKAGSS